jgi:hypothetical protein
MLEDLPEQLAIIAHFNEPILAAASLRTVAKIGAELFDYVMTVVCRYRPDLDDIGLVTLLRELDEAVLGPWVNGRGLRLVALRGYLIVAAGLVLARIVTLAASGGWTMRILKSLFGLVLSVLGAAIRVAAEIALIRIVDLRISVV